MEVLGSPILATRRRLETLGKARVETKTRTRIADAAIDNIALPAFRTLGAEMGRGLSSRSAHQAPRYLPTPR